MSEHPFGIGRPVARKEDFRLLTGTGRFTDDSYVPSELYGVVVRSPLGAIKIFAASATPERVWWAIRDAGGNS